MPPIAANDQFADLRFPLRGLSRSSALSRQQAQTTPTGVNVRAVEALTRRLRGGSRPGLARHIDDALPGEVQELNLVVLPSATALGISFDDVAILDANFQLVDPTDPPFILADLTTNWIRIGGSGYYTPQSYTRRYEPEIDTVSPDDGAFEGGEIVTLTGQRMGDVNSEFRFGDRSATVLTNDGTTATVISPEQDEPEDGGPLTINIVVDTGVGRSAAAAGNEYTYQDMTLVQSSFSASSSDNGSTITATMPYTSPVAANNLLVAVVIASGQVTQTGVVTDDAGNVWTLAARKTVAEPQVPTPYANLIAEIWYAVAATAAAVEVSSAWAYTVDDGPPSLSTLILEFSGCAAASPLDDTVTNAANEPVGTGQEMTTGTIPLTTAGGLLIGAFGNVGINPSGGAGANGFSLVGGPGTFPYVVYLLKAQAGAAAKVTFDNAVTPDAATQYAAVGVSFKKA